MTQQTTAQQPLPKVLWALLFGNFVIGTCVMIAPGVLSVIGQSVVVSVAVAGQLISACALLMCIGAPLLVRHWATHRASKTPPACANQTY